MFIMKLLKGLVIIPLLFLGACSSNAETVNPTVAPTAQTATKEEVELPEYSMTEDERVSFCGAVQAAIDSRGSIDWSAPSPDKPVSDFSLKLADIAKVAPETHQEKWQELADIDSKLGKMDASLTEEVLHDQVKLAVSLREVTNKECNLPMP